MNFNIVVIKLQLAQIARQQEQKRLQYIQSIKQGSK
jgi:hypothetical protein